MTNLLRNMIVSAFSFALCMATSVHSVEISGNVEKPPQWIECVPTRVAARSSGDMHIGCENVPGWYVVKATSKNAEFRDRFLYLGTSALIAGKTLKLYVPKHGKDGGEVVDIEILR